MTKKQAIKALVCQKQKLNDSFQFGDSIWIGITLDYIEMIFTKESNAYQSLSTFRPFDLRYAEANYPLVKEKLNKMFDEWVAMIKVDAFDKKERKNFLSKLSDRLIIAIITVIIPGIFFAGYKIGKFIQKNEKTIPTPVIQPPLKDSTSRSDTAG